MRVIIAANRAYFHIFNVISFKLLAYRRFKDFDFPRLRSTNSEYYGSPPIF